MKAYTSKLDRARSIAISYGYSETDPGFDNIVRHFLSKLIVGAGTISKNGDTGKLSIIR